jgi:hypothetical protein
MAETPKCSVENCGSDAIVEVLLYDFYAEMPEVFLERDITCPFLCAEHMVQNEQQAFTALTKRELSEWVEDLQDILKQPAPTVFARMVEGHAEMNVSRIERQPEAISVGEIGREPEYHLPPIRKPRGHVSYPFTNRHDAQGFTVYRNLD